MAYQVVEADPYEGGSGKYVAKKKVGDGIEGYYVSDEPGTGQYGGIDVTVRLPTGEDKILSANGALKNQIEKAKEAGMSRGHGFLAKIKSQKDIGKQNLLNVWGVAFDRNPKKPMPETAVDGDDAIPF